MQKINYFLLLILCIPALIDARVYVYNKSGSDLIVEINAMGKEHQERRFERTIGTQSGHWIDLEDADFKNIVLKRASPPGMVSHEFSEWTIADADFCPTEDIGFLLDLKRGSWIMGAFSHRAVVVKAVSIVDSSTPFEKGKELQLERTAQSAQWYVF
jgi:hypothetical protein